MRIFRPLFSAATLAIAAVLFTSPSTAHADTYQLFNLGSGTQTDVIGIDNKGAVVLFNTDLDTYQTWINGMPTSVSATKPNLTYDNGTPCSVLPMGATNLSRCNDGHEILEHGAVGKGGTPITDPPPNAVVLVDTGSIFVNSLGDYVATVGIGDIGNDLDGEIIEGIDLTTRATPEPATFILFGTGLLAGLGSMRPRQKRT